jgi:hypothetical protein
MSISAQQEPWLPTPVFGLLLEGVHPSTLALCTRGQRNDGGEGGGPTDLTVDELEISWALRITVSHAILCTGLVGWELSHAPICHHPRHIQCSVQSTRKMRNIDVKCELLVQHVEHLIVVVIRQQIEAGSNILLSTLRDEVEL